MKRQKYKVQANGETQREQWYALARRYCGIIANRQRTNKRCKRCFKMRFLLHDKTNRPRYGCDGCCEMDDFFTESAALFNGVEIYPRWRILCGR